jgi:hypothetical protein
VSDLKPDRQRRDLHKSNLPVTSRKIGPVSHHSRSSSLTLAGVVVVAGAQVGPVQLVSTFGADEPITDADAATDASVAGLSQVLLVLIL